MRKLVVAVAVAVALVLTMPIAAQVPPPPERGREVVAEFLALSPEQVAAWDELLVGRDQAVEPLRAEVGEVEEALRALLDQAEPPLDQVGELVVQRRDLEGQLQGVVQAYVEGFEALLDEEQGRKLELVRHADRLQPLLPAFQRLGLLPRR